MKDVPYFPCYAANILSSRSYRLMSLSERGLWISIWMECWINGGVPANFKEMAKILNFPEDEVRNAFSSLHSTFIHEENGQYISKELNEYRSGYEERREKQRLGGIKGSERKKEKRAKMERIEAVPQGIPQGVPKGSLSYINSNSVTSNQLINKEVLVQSNDEWVMDYENTPDAGEYVRHSRGS